jgi:beta-phosphoglucomutase-like phosphatase (HAD superfamily)
MTSVQAVLFDLDGTLVDSEELHRQAFNHAFLKFRLGWSWNPFDYEALLNVSGGAERIGVYVEKLRLPPAETSRLRRLVPAVHREKTRLYGELLAGGSVRLRSGVARLFGEAREAGVKIGLVATSSLANVQNLLTAILGSEGSKAIGAVVGADLVEHKKPAPDIYRLLLSMVRAPAARCVAFEDSANGLAAAKTAGLCTVVTPSGWTRAQDFASADLLLGKLGDPSDPLEAGEALRIGGAAYLGIIQIEALHAATTRGRRRVTGEGGGD